MKINTQIMRLILLCAIAMVANATLVSAQERQDEALKKVIAFLNGSEELRNYSDNGFTSQFTGELLSIPDELQSELSQNFPEYKFYIAKMTVLIDAPSKKYDLVLIANTISGEIEGFVWGNYWTLRPSKSFQLLLKGHQAKSNDDAITQVKTFAKLLGFASNGKIGDSKIQNGKVKVELIRGEGVFGILEVEINKCLLFDRLTITEPNGKKLKYFV
jgi:hypothetical protein